MILTCPDCATSYFVDDARIPPEGRVVKCSSCGNRWRAEREAPAEAASSEPEIVAEPPVIEDDIVAEPAPAAQLPPEDVEIVAEPAPEPALRRRSARPPPKPKAKSKRGAVIAWTALAATVVAAAGVVVFRDQIVRMAPASGGVFAAVGLPVDRLGLTIGDVRSVATLQGGRPVLSITGAIRNTRSETVTAPPLRVSILDRSGKPVAARIARPLNADVPPGATRYFAIAIADPPAGSASLDIVFEASPTPTAVAPADAAQVDARMGPEPLDATPAPEHSEAAADHG
ncbi:DUF3426 domain-containing protein [Phenylobacterium sp. J426]|uniref:DUF3426 domain-containing protein n=1 Tax=Phenylobacterium sp. J426 TaxID=2898439 RepID=UPI0021511382|nr:DUF3426 domain-containing protein [Phenylobacterium sp. J426]MCR5874657.1 DUF3426 domain-containing protein [Phenylobacterium sp. J426]